MKIGKQLQNRKRGAPKSWRRCEWKACAWFSLTVVSLLFTLWLGRSIQYLVQTESLAELWFLLASVSALTVSVWQLTGIISWQIRVLKRLERQADFAFEKARRLRTPEIVAEMFTAEFCKALAENAKSRGTDAVA